MHPNEMKTSDLAEAYESVRSQQTQHRLALLRALEHRVRDEDRDGRNVVYAGIMYRLDSAGDLIRFPSAKGTRYNASARKKRLGNAATVTRAAL